MVEIQEQKRHAPAGRSSLVEDVRELRCERRRHERKGQMIEDGHALQACALKRKLRATCKQLERHRLVRSKRVRLRRRRAEDTHDDAADDKRLENHRTDLEALPFDALISRVRVHVAHDEPLPELENPTHEPFTAAKRLRWGG